MTGAPSLPSLPSPAVPIEVVSVVRDTSAMAQFAPFPGAYDVVAVQSAEPEHLPASGSPWWLVSPHGHRVAVVSVMSRRGDDGHARVTTEDDDRIGPARVEMHLAVGERDGWLVHPGDGWMLQPASYPVGDGIEALLLKVTEASRRRSGSELLFALDQTWAPLLRSASEVVVTDVPGHPVGAVERCLEDHGEGDAPRMVVAVHLAVDPWLNVGAVYRLKPCFGPATGQSMSQAT